MNGLKILVPVTKPVSWTELCQGVFAGAVIISFGLVGAAGAGGALGAGGGHIMAPSWCTIDPRMTSSSMFRW